MTRLCAWCNRVLGQVAPLDDVSVTHGVCPECHAKIVGTDANDADAGKCDPQASLKSAMLSADVAE
ncbi:MAG: hypothetical protein HYR84_08430 [Planctomycetes bacterium]|nr:hypothetical protein [Planctomycetota bacterium]